MSGKPRNLLFCFNNQLRLQIFSPAPIFCPLYNIGLIVFTPSAVCYNAVTCTQNQHMSRVSYVSVAPSPVPYVVHLALNTYHASPCDKTCIPPPVYLGDWHLATISRVVMVTATHQNKAHAATCLVSPSRAGPVSCTTVFCVKVHESFRESFQRFHGSFHSFHESSFHEIFHGNFHGISGRCRGSHCHGSFHGSFYESFHFHEKKASTEASTKAFTEASTKASTEVLPRKLPRIRKLPRKHFHRFLGFSSMEASGSFHGRSEAKRLPRKASMKAFEVVSTKSWKPHPRNFTFYFHRSFRSFHRISAASTTAPTDRFVLYTTMPPVELTTFSTTWLTHTVYETKGVSPYIGCCVSLV